MKKTIRNIGCTIALGVAMVGCNSGSSSWQAGNLGSLGVEMESVQLVVGQSTQVTATLTNAYQGSDPIGSATINFYVWNSFNNGVPESSNIATLQPVSCVISNPAESITTSCSITLTATTPGNSNVYVEAVPNSNMNTTPPTNNYIFESFTINN
ncbi:hypothetical protein [Aquella oligotrophica]|uniref:CARDB domain-containing protein n=1 Tax=Aquella oligotrophica TaxID=2067065 RepID=A0A2I7N7M8_9NEIS|nr:hypothetical protein [Aquella oligotrophica]AUR52467.1 hypothetical protein CUN60_09210 [Aquella oligotrophica]